MVGKRVVKSERLLRKELRSSRLALESGSTPRLDDSLGLSVHIPVNHDRRALQGHPSNQTKDTFPELHFFHPTLTIIVQLILREGFDPTLWPSAVRCSAFFPPIAPGMCARNDERLTL